jgi:hypothetical protein
MTITNDVNYLISGASAIKMRLLSGDCGSLSFEGSAGQLFSITNNLGTGSIFSVNDISGIPSIDVDANGKIVLAGFTGNVGVGETLPSEKLDVLGNLKVSGDYIGRIVRSINGITGAVGLSAGSNVTITQSGNTLTIASTASGGGGTSYAFYQGSTAPTGFSAGDRWYNTDLGKLLTGVNDGATAIWVEFAGPAGPQGPDGDPFPIIWFMGV